MKLITDKFISDFINMDDEKVKYEWKQYTLQSLVYIDKKGT